jgi:hypothetical protein
MKRISREDVGRRRKIQIVVQSTISIAHVNKDKQCVCKPQVYTLMASKKKAGGFREEQINTTTLTNGAQSGGIKKPHGEKASEWLCLRPSLILQARC